MIITIGILIITVTTALMTVITVQHLSKIIKKEFEYHFNSVSFKNVGGRIIPILEYDFSKSGMPVIEIKIQGKPFKFMLDSGANINVLTSSVFNSLDSSSIKKEESEGFITANGSVSENIFKASIEFKYKTKKFHEIFEILDMSEAFDSINNKDGVRIHGILGSSFFNKYRWVLDFENMVVWTKL